MPTRPGLWIYPGIIPILHSPGLIMPGQFGPINRVFDCLLRAAFTRTWCKEKEMFLNIQIIQMHQIP